MLDIDKLYFKLLTSISNSMLEAWHFFFRLSNVEFVSSNIFCFSIFNSFQNHAQLWTKLFFFFFSSTTYILKTTWYFVYCVSKSPIKIIVSVLDINIFIKIINNIFSTWNTLTSRIRRKWKIIYLCSSYKEAMLIDCAFYRNIHWKKMDWFLK